MESELFEEVEGDDAVVELVVVVVVDEEDGRVPK
jgi:hypothetical protein